ncbi:MAG: hypothetical protein RMI34_12715 [Chloroherpetonaceae bacterium]|nr:hypothetical protein [Chloroherpetonaceae bacterium]MCS7210655.1 hypothetical protein [Chloroherpetonaceae bacterium]MDW8020920.1 hypothetical protein [Chloroherpetonaceae bacterium]
MMPGRIRVVVSIRLTAQGVSLAAALLFLLATDSPAQVLVKRYAEARLAAQQRAMWILGAWAGASILSGVGLSLQSENTVLRYWGFQNLGWGAVNAAIASAALLGLGSQLAALDTLGTDGKALLQELSEEQNFSKILLVNVGLDVGYMLVGGALAWAARNGLSRSDEFFGSGLGIIVQGAFLLFFDIWQVLASSARISDLEQALRPMLSLKLTPSDAGLMLTLLF